MGRSVSKLLLDALLAADAVLLAYYLRLGDQLLHFAGYFPFTAAGVCFAIALPVTLGMRLNRSLWRYTSLADLVQIAKAATLLLAVFYLGVFFTDQLSVVPRSLPLIHWLLLVALWCAPRVLYRLWHYRQRYVRLATDASVHRRVPVLLIGTNTRAELFIRETADRPLTPYRVVGIMDLNPALEGQSLHGIPIYTKFDRLKDIVAVLAESHVRPQKIVIADDAVEGPVLEKLLSCAEELGIGLARMPRQTELQSGTQPVLDVRPIAIEDILGRAQHVHDREAMRRFIEGKSVLITGAGGTIGSELARQVASFAPSKLVLFDISEFHLYQIHRELSGVPVTAMLGDVRDSAALEAAVSEHKPVVVFHAAAIKHVPIAQDNPIEAILTNVCGTRIVAQTCARHHVGAVVLISTDKAVNPTNVMGATKRLAEKIFLLAQQQDGTHFVTVRFGNVLGSTGSVVPLFQEQLARGGPLTVTHEAMERYFMTVREAVELVLQAAAMGQGEGGTYVLDMGKPMKIVTLAEQMIRLAGCKPHEDVNIIFTGLRPGEKLTEELFYASENPSPTAHAAIRRAAKPDHGISQDLLTSIEEAARKRQAAQALAQLKALVPEFKEQP